MLFMIKLPQKEVIFWVPVVKNQLPSVAALLEGRLVIKSPRIQNSKVVFIYLTNEEKHTYV